MGKMFGRSVGAMLMLGAALLVSDLSAASAASDASQFWQKLKQKESGQPSRRIGGGCDYVSIAGTAKITRVAKTAESSQQAKVGGGPGYAGYEVRFAFTPASPVSDGATRQWIGKPHQLRLTNSWYPGPKFIEKYGLKQGRSLPAALKVRTSGACTPFVFEFPGVDTSDYFETGK